MSLQAVYNRFVKALSRTLPEPIRIIWDSKNYLVSSSQPNYAGAVTTRLRNEEELRKELKYQGVGEKVIDKVIEILPRKKSITLYPKSYITLLPSPQYYCLMGDWVILYNLDS